MTQHPHIEDLERLALYRHTLTPDQVLGIAGHVRDCLACRDILNEIDELSRAMEDLSEDEVERQTARIMAVADRRRTGNMIVLHLQPEPEFDAENGAFALAAKSEEAQISYRPIATLYSDDGRTLLRILHEREHSSYFFQLMSEFMDRVPHALLTAPGREPLMTDVDGALRIPDTDIDIVQIASMSVFYALDRLRTGAIRTAEFSSHDGVVLASDDSTLQLRSEGDSLNVLMRWHGAEESAPRFVGIVSGHRQAVGRFEDGRASIPLASMPEDGMVILY